MPAKNRALNLQGKGSQWGRQQAILRSEFVRCTFRCAQGQVREREIERRTQKEKERKGGRVGAGRGGGRERERERRREYELTALEVLQEFYGTEKSSAFSELIPDCNLPYGRLPEGHDSSA